MTAECMTLWIGESMGPVERACLRSVARQGHKVALYCYDEPKGVPNEVEVRDASAIIPQDAISAPWVARADLYSDWFRYELLKRGLGVWVDADVYLLRPLDMGKPYLFGVQDAAIVNNAVLRLPADSPILADLLEPFTRRTTPKTLPWHKYFPLRARALLTGQVNLTKVPWGTTSPYALTKLARKHGLEHWAEPQECFYPVPWQRANWIADPAVDLDDVITDSTVAIHLWNRCISAFKNDPAPAGSFLDRLHREGA